jgi:hypothetical protein
VKVHVHRLGVPNVQVAAARLANMTVKKKGRNASEQKKNGKEEGMRAVSWLVGWLVSAGIGGDAGRITDPPRRSKAPNQQGQQRERITATTTTKDTYLGSGGNLVG